MLKEIIKELLREELNQETRATNTATIPENEFWEIGKDYVVRTVTMIYLGELKAFNQGELLLENCAWIPDTSRWNEFLRGKKPNEMEPYNSDVIISRSAILDATSMKSKIKREVI